MTLRAAVEAVTLPWKIAGSIAQGFGLLGLALAALGIYGLVAYTVSQRTREIGVRVALGAAPADIRKLVVNQGLRLAVVGVAIGLVLSFGVTRVLAAVLFGVSASDPLTYVGTAIVLAVVAMAASYIPARNATRTDPLVALRQD
jgi:ABC-type antimicrobial peptide transport system permease subunit